MSSPFPDIFHSFDDPDELYASVSASYDALDTIVHEHTGIHSPDEMIDTQRRLEGDVTRRVTLERRKPGWMQIEVVVDGRAIGRSALSGWLSYMHHDELNPIRQKSRGPMQVFTAFDELSLDAQFARQAPQFITSGMTLILMKGVIEGVSAELADGVTSVTLH